ncbi:AAA family ATPase, partial [Halobacterium sp. CBA1126]|uniref:ParA family protein n=1 Tax=Halobacterium sp. CBA1126 TaxID=2668074 RepID=UPI0012F868B5|nr:AAA family ATPase [Halobacterium sp. CBA1126]
MGQTKRASTYLDKGGVGKSTATAHLGAALQDDGHDVLLVDLAGKQDDLGSIYGIHEAVREDIENDNDYPNVTTTMEENWTDIVDLVGGPEAALDELVYETDEGVDIIPRTHPRRSRREPRPGGRSRRAVRTPTQVLRRHRRRNRPLRHHPARPP